MKGIKISFSIILIVLIFLSLSVVSAADNSLNDDLNESDFDAIRLASINDDSYASLDADDLNSSVDLNESYSENQIDDSLKDDSTKFHDKDSDKSSSYEDSKLKSAEYNSKNLSEESSVIVINSSTYADYFDASNHGAIIGDSIKDGDTIKIESISDVIFTIDRQVTITSDSSYILYDCLIRLVKGSSNSLIDGLRIINTKEKLSGMYLSGIHIIDSWNNTIANNKIDVSGRYSFAIALENSSYNEISNNVLNSKSSYVMPLTGSSHNVIENNDMSSESSNLIYYCPYTVGNLFSRSQYIKSTDNVIANNTLSAKASSNAYAINLESEVAGCGNRIADNTIYNVSTAIKSSVKETVIENNTIFNVSKAIVVDNDDITVNDNKINRVSKVAIESAGDNVKITNNVIVLEDQTGINFTGSHNLIENNTIQTESGNGIYYYNFNNKAGYNNISGNSINSSNAIVMSASRESMKDRIENNDIFADANAICLIGHLIRPTIINNNIESADEDSIKLVQYNDKDKTIPQNYSVYDNTVNGVKSNLTDGPWINPNMENLTLILDKNILESGESLIIYLKDKSGNPIASQHLSIDFLNNVYDLISDNLGSVSLQVNESVGNYSFSVYYGGLEDSYNPLNQSFNIDVTLATVFEVKDANILKGTYFEVYLKDHDGNVLGNKNVLITMNGKTYTVKTDSSGKARLQINLPVNRYDVVLKYDGESNYLSSSNSSNCRKKWHQRFTEKWP